jgi:hypothetical protein
VASLQRFGDLDEKSDGGLFGAENGLEARATLPAYRCHLDNAAIPINCYYRDDAAIGEENIFERAISVQ